MSDTQTGDLDVPVVPSAEQIRRYEFATKRRGYDIDQVRDYLGRVADQVETLEHELGRSKAAEERVRKPTPGEALAALAAEQQTVDEMPVVTPPPPPVDEYELLGQRFASLIETADREATAVVDEAKAEADRILEEARSEADRIRVDAQARAEEARQEASEALVQARREADRILGSLSDRRENLVTQMHEMQSRLLAVANDLEIAMDDRDEAIKEAVARRTSVSTPPPPAAGDDDPVDPRYEDLWASEQKSVEIPDLEPIDLEFSEERGKESEE